MKMGTKVTLHIKEQNKEEILKKIEENYKLLWKYVEKYGRMGRREKWFQNVT